MLLPLNLASITLAFGIITQSKESRWAEDNTATYRVALSKRGGLAFVDQKAICVWISKDRKVCLKSTSQEEGLQACIGRSTDADSTLHTQIVDLQMTDHDKCTHEMLSILRNYKQYIYEWTSMCTNHSTFM